MDQVSFFPFYFSNLSIFLINFQVGSHYFLDLLWRVQAIVDSLSFELPKAAARFAGFSDRCLEIADSVVDRFVSICNPRDMLSILCEVNFVYFHSLNNVIIELTKKKCSNRTQ